MSEADGNPAWDEAVAAFGRSEPAELVRPARTVVVDVARTGTEWVGTSDQLDGFRVTGESREAVWKAAMQALAGWLDPGVALEFAEKS